MVIFNIVYVCPQQNISNTLNAAKQLKREIYTKKFRGWCGRQKSKGKPNRHGHIYIYIGVVSCVIIVCIGIYMERWDQDWENLQ